MSHRKRFVVEATWSGYTSEQSRVVHRTVETTFRAGYEGLYSHMFSDGTLLYISVRDAKPREKVTELKGYKVLLTDLAMNKWKELKGDAS